MHKKIEKKKIKDPNSQLNSEDIEQCKDPAQISEWKIYIESSMAAADLRINTAKGIAASKGDFMEPAKYNGLLSYRKALGFLHQKIIFQQRILKSENKMADHFPRIFTQVAKSMLPQDEYDKIYNKALEIIAAI